MMSRLSERIRVEVREIFEVRRRERPDAPTLDLWTEALSLHRVRYERTVLPAPEGGEDRA